MQLAEWGVIVLEPYAHKAAVPSNVALSCGKIKHTIDSDS